MAKLTPFADDATSISIGKLTIENGTDRIALYGSVDLTRDKQGLQHAQALKALLDQAVELLQAEKNLPDSVRPRVRPRRFAIHWTDAWTLRFEAAAPSEVKMPYWAGYRQVG